MISRILRLLGLGTAARGEAGPAEDAVEYHGFMITPAPVKEAAGWRVAAVITKTIDGETRTHRLTRADVFAERAFVVEMSVQKARRVIDEKGDALLPPGEPG